MDLLQPERTRRAVLRVDEVGGDRREAIVSKGSGRSDLDRRTAEQHVDSATQETTINAVRPLW